MGIHPDLSAASFHQAALSYEFRCHWFASERFTQLLFIAAEASIKFGCCKGAHSTTKNWLNGSVPALALPGAPALSR